MTQTCCGRGGCRNDPYPSGIVVRMLDNRQSLFRSVRDPSTKLLRTLGAPLHDRANCLVVAACLLLFTFCCWFESYSTVLLESPASWQSNTLTWSSPNVPGLHLQQVLGVYQKGLALLKKRKGAETYGSGSKSSRVQVSSKSLAQDFEKSLCSIAFPYWKRRSRWIGCRKCGTPVIKEICRLIGWTLFWVPAVLMQVTILNGLCLFRTE